MSDLQTKLDDLLNDLDLTIKERGWIRKNWKTNRAARQVVNLIGEVVEQKTMEQKRIVLEQLFDAVKRARKIMQSEHFDAPDGFSLIDEAALDAFRKVAACQIQLATLGTRDPARGSLIRQMNILAHTAANLDPAVDELAHV
jgi:hypothetical protein